MSIGQISSFFISLKILGPSLSRWFSSYSWPVEALECIPIFLRGGLNGALERFVRGIDKCIMHAVVEPIHLHAGVARTIFTSS